MKEPDFPLPHGDGGTYTITGVAEGTYTVTASATGYVSSSEEAEVVAGATSTLDFWLDPLGSAESGGED